MKFVIALMFVAILAALFGAGRAMLKNGKPGEPKSHRMANALAWRVGLSVALFLMVLLAWQFGWIQPTGLQAGK
ncbi:DUF2909 domain-containing protein [Rivibacter subsaxonicus]|uniref:DUF2909 family protein n=1 Tax=Rivibacter subsaxonicus TaxID=457575 RepID=A0A4Q7VGN9_9BURK|nr:DUF2909 domain-containing protein [Rivibacter subsaxonicus]RZT95203.1 DUF2909 family protein [Rivibacter subsaxonicus]